MFDSILVFIIVVVAGWFLVMEKGEGGREQNNEGKQEEKLETSPYCDDLLPEQIGKKNENKKRIISLMIEQDELSNSEVASFLGVSNRTVVKYMDELEEEKKVLQVGKTGRGVVYRLK